MTLQLADNGQMINLVVMIIIVVLSKMQVPNEMVIGTLHKVGWAVFIYLKLPDTIDPLCEYEPGYFHVPEWNILLPLTPTPRKKEPQRQIERICSPSLKAAGLAVGSKCILSCPIHANYVSNQWLL